MPRNLLQKVLFTKLYKIKGNIKSLYDRHEVELLKFLFATVSEHFTLIGCSNKISGDQIIQLLVKKFVVFS